MSKNCCDNEPYCYNNNCCNPDNGYNNNFLGANNSLLYTLAILLIFGGGSFGTSSFWGDYNNIFACSGFNTAWCNSPIFNNENFINNNFSNQ